MSNLKKWIIISVMIWCVITALVGFLCWINKNDFSYFMHIMPPISVVWFGMCGELALLLGLVNEFLDEKYNKNTTKQTNNQNRQTKF